MKPGTGDNAYGEQGDSDDGEDTNHVDNLLNAEIGGGGETSDDPDDRQPADLDPDTDGAASTGDGGATAATGASGGGVDPADIPLAVRRDGVEDERTERMVSKVRPEVARAESALIREVADLLDMDEQKVYKFDIREAEKLIAQDHPELVAEYLENEIGYNYFEE